MGTMTTRFLWTQLCHGTIQKLPEVHAQQLPVPLPSPHTYLPTYLPLYSWPSHHSDPGSWTVVSKFGLVLLLNSVLVGHPCHCPWPGIMGQEVLSLGIFFPMLSVQVPCLLICVSYGRVCAVVLPQVCKYRHTICICILYHHVHYYHCLIVVIVMLFICIVYMCNSHPTLPQVLLGTMEMKGWRNAQ